MIRAREVGVTRRGRGRAPVEALAGASFEVHPGGLLLLLGRPGAGKTTLLECLAGLLPLTRGEVRLRGGGHEWRWGAGIAPPAGARAGAGLLFQYPERQLVGRTPLEDVAWGVAGAGALEAAREALRRASVPDLLWEAPVQRLSRGEKRRVALAGVLARGPQVLLLDEPSVGLDPEGQDLLWREVESFRSRGGAAVVATHWPEPILPLATTVLCLEQGRVTFRGAPGALIQAATASRALSELLPFPWRLAAAFAADRPAPPGSAGWESAARLWLQGAGRVPWPDQAEATSFSRASQMAETSARSPSSRS